MTLKEPDFIDLPTLTGPMRVHRFLPAEGAFPAVILYSEIFQVTAPIRRLAAKLAGEGFEVFVPEIYHEFEAPGTVLAYDAAGSARGNQLKHEKPMASFDSDARELIEWIVGGKDGNEPYRWQGVGTLGFCLGGHLAFRAALYPRVAAAACYYATNLHTADLGQAKRDDTLARSGEIEAELLMIWGRQDPHVPLEGRKRIYDVLTEKDRKFQWHEFNGAHAFSRDEGNRYDAAASRLSWDLVLDLFKRKLVATR